MRTKSELEAIPGVGVRMARHLERIGCPTLASLRGQDPEELYRRDCLSQGCQVDRCVLYVYRLAVHYAEHGQCPPDKQNWWDWKDK
ncbi:MAG: Pathogenicity locus [Lawsonibacter sp.]|nr:Pathogenicity locus [Lawsonibacter sp.]